MATLIITLATLYIEYIVYDHPAVVLGTVCLHLFFTRCSEYLRKRRFVRYYKQITNGGMDCKYSWGIPKTSCSLYLFFPCIS